MNLSDPQPTYDLARAALRGAAIDRQVLGHLADDLEIELFGNPPGLRPRPDVSLHDPRLTTYLDVMGTLAILVPDEVSDVWRLGGIFGELDRDLLAAEIHLLEAASRSAQLAESGEGLPDEEDWTLSCFDHAVGHFIWAQHLLAATLLFDRLTEEDRLEANRKLGDAMEDASGTTTGQMALEVAGGRPVDIAHLEGFKQDLLGRIFGDQLDLTPGSASDAVWREPRLIELLDALAALAQLQPDDVRPAAEQAAVLGALGLHLEAAQVYLSDAAPRAVSPDRWRSRAARHLALEGHLLSAAVVISGLDQSSRADAQPEITEALARPVPRPRRWRGSAADLGDSAVAELARWALKT